MMFQKIWMKIPGWGRAAVPALAALALAACANTPPPAPPLPQTAANGEPILAAGDVAIAGQEAAHSIMDLPEVANASTPPLVRFTGVTSALNGPVDTEPYTDLLRDRLLLITREKLRFVEHVLPPLHSHHKSAQDQPPSGEGSAQYEIAARLGNDASPDTYLLRIQFIDLHSGEAIFTGLYRINPEAPQAPETPVGGPTTGTSLESTAPAGGGTVTAPYPPSSQGANLP